MKTPTKQPLKSTKPTYLIGDVHGCFYTLQALVNKLLKDCDIIFVGDLIDKGNFSKEVIQFAIDNNYRCLIGNHEDMMKQYIKAAVYNNDFSSDWAKINGWGALKCIEEYKQDIQTLEKHLLWLETLPLYLEIDNYFITHGFGLPYYKRKDNKDKQIALFTNRINKDTYKDDWEDFENYEVINIFGHCVFDEVLVGKNYFGIDTGCVYDGKLTAIALHTHEIVQQNLLNIDVA